MTAKIEGLLLEIAAPVASITLNRPERSNAIDVRWIAPLKEFFEQVSAMREVRCIVIRSTGKHFSAGADMGMESELEAMAATAKLGAQVDITLRWNEMTAALLNVPQPVVASVQGGVVGGSVGLMLMCDLVIAAESAFFLLAHVNVGVPLSESISYYLPRQIGYKRSMQLALLGDRVPAREAERLGLFNFVVPNDQLAAETDKLVQRLAHGPTLAYAHIKRQIMGSFGHSRQEQTLLECIAAARSSQTQDVSEGVAAVIEKRKPNFKGL